MKEKQEKRHRRHRRIRAKVKGTKTCPRLCVFRSANHIYAQLIDDDRGKVIVSVNDFKIVPLKTKSHSPRLNPKKSGIQAENKGKIRPELSEGKDKSVKSGKVAVAYEIGKIIAQRAIEKKVKKVIFDRGGYKYHGRVKALADGAREGGLRF